jgi:hypothetical protein
VSTQAQTVFVSRLRQTIPLEPGRIKQIFDVVNVPGLQVVCVSTIEGDGDFEPISQTYVLPDGNELDSVEDALLAWDDLKDEVALLDTIASALLRHKHGLIRPLWEQRTAEQKAVWITQARQFKSLAESLGLQVARRGASQ